MLSATDTFIQYLSAGLNDQPKVAWMRETSTDPATSQLQMDTLNVSILGFQQDGRVECPLVSLDLLGSDERTVIRWVQAVRDLLFDRQYITEIDYDTSPLTPRPLGRAVYWDAAAIDFKVIAASPRAVHMNATFELYHVRQ